MNTYKELSKSISETRFTELAKIELNEDVINPLEFRVTPNEGIHKGVEYTLKIQFIEKEWPRIYIDSEIYDKIKTSRYLLNRGKNGSHKGICIKNMSYCYSFKNNFERICNNDWSNYLYLLILTFNNLHDLEGANGIKKNYLDYI